MLCMLFLHDKINPLRPSVISLGKINGGATYNVIPNEVHIQGTIRSHEEAVRAQLWAEIERALSLSKPLGGDYKLDIVRGYPALFNEAKVNQWLKDVTREMVGETAVMEEEFGMGAEDFAYMAQKAPGAMFMLGAALPDGPTRHHHTDTFDIDESVLPMGAAILAETARRFVTGQLM